MRILPPFRGAGKRSRRPLALEAFAGAVFGAVLMKKFLVSLFILAVFAGVVFYFGWVQFAVPAGHTGVMISKTSGIDPNPIIPGEFRWAWEKLFPTNCRILAFTLRPVERSFAKSGTLPSAELYARFLEGSPSFSWTISASVSVRAEQDALPNIVEKYGVESEDELNALVSSIAEQAFLQAAEKYIALSAEKAAALQPTESGGSGAFQFLQPPDFAALFAEELPEGFSALSASVEEASLPDFALYTAGAAVYAEYAERRMEAATAAALRAAEEEVANSEQMRLFAEWGSFLEKFPSLIDFLAVARDSASETLDLLRDLKNSPSSEGAQATSESESPAP